MCEKGEFRIMATNLDLDDRLILKAQSLGGHRTKRETVMRALLEYVQSLEQKKILDLFGRVEFDESYNHKKQRSRT
jgi:Arc/MetJ family transcription regulator